MTKKYGWQVVSAIASALAAIFAILQYLSPFITSVTHQYGDFTGLAIFFLLLYLLFGKQYKV